MMLSTYSVRRGEQSIDLLPSGSEDTTVKGTENTLPGRQRRAITETRGDTFVDYTYTLIVGDRFWYVDVGNYLDGTICQGYRAKGSRVMILNFNDCCKRNYCEIFFYLRIMLHLMHCRCSEILHVDNNIYNEFKIRKRFIVCYFSISCHAETER